jgi:hypothetical protein
MQTLYARIFACLDNLIPGLPDISTAGAAFYAPAPYPGDMALFCNVAACRDDILELEMANDSAVRGSDQPSQWMKFKIDRRTKTACVLACQSGTRYETVGDATIYPHSARLPLNSFAANWLSILVNRHLAFQSVVQIPSFN